MSINTSDLIRASGMNHQAAQRASTEGRPQPGSVPIPATPITAAPAIPSAYGGGGSEPTGAIATAWHYIQQWVGYVWPNGSAERLDTAAQAWTTAFNSIKSGDTAIDWATNDLASQQSPEVPAAIAHLKDLRVKFGSLAGACLQMATSCNNFAQAIKDAHNKLVDELSEFAAEFVVGEIVFGVLVEVGGELWGNAAMAVRGMAIAQRCARIIEKLVELAKNAARVARRAAESIADVVGKIRSTIEALVNRVPSVVGKDVKTLTRAPEFRFSRNQLHSKYKHAPDFGLNGNCNPENLDRFERILEDFLSSRSTVHIKGTYRGDEGILNVDPTTGLTGIQRVNGEFWSCWKLSADQLQIVLERGSL